MWEALIAAGAAAVAAIFVVRRRRRRALPAPVVETPSLWNVRPGGVVEVEGEMMDVRRVIDCRDGAEPWREIMLAGETLADKVWLSIEDDDGLRITRAHPVDAPLPDDAGVPRTVTFEGVSFELEEKGRAQGRLAAVDVPEREVSFAYASWEDARGRRLIVERWGGDTDWYLGEALDPGLVDVFGG